jgi:hypothetical protein
MSYDYQFDMSAGTPNAPLAWVEDIIKWTKSKITDWNKIVIGLPTAGYSGLTGGYVITGRTYDYLSIQTGFSGAVRDVASAEIIWSDAGTSYALNDETSVNTKMKSAEAFGVKNISLWHIGQNKYDNLRVHGVQPLDTTVPSVSDVDITTVTTTSTLPTASRFVVSTGTITLTLPTGVLGQIVSIKNVGTGTVTATSSGTIDFGTSFATATVALTSDTSQDFLYDGTNWQRI